MRWVSAILVVVATPAVLIAAFVFVPIGWLAAASMLFLLVGAAVALATRGHSWARPGQSTVE